MENIKPGYKTSEFWFTVVATVIGLLMSSGAIIPNSPIAQVIGFIGSILGVMGYQYSRGIAKS